MKKIITSIIGLAFAGSAIAEITLIHNVNGYTLANNQLKQFGAITIKDDAIIRTYSATEDLPTNATIKQIDGKGATMLPGLIDAHGHVLNYGLSLQRVDLVGTTSEQDAINTVLAYKKENPNQRWIQGRGWNQVHWPSKEFPTAAALDKYFPNTPIFLSRVDGHAGWANSKAMELAGITQQTLSPNGGEIIKLGDGKPSGVFIDNAMDLIYSKIPALSKQEQKSALIKAMNALASVGLTSVHDAGITAENIDVFKEIANEEAMPIRVNAMLYLPSKGWETALKTGHYKSNDNSFAFNSVKIQADGALGSRGAAMHADYSDKAGHKGLLLHTNEELSHYIKEAMQAGFQVNTHAIGDHANSLTLDQYRQHIASTKSEHLRHRIEHAQVLRVEDIPRFKTLNVIASIQATHATSDKNMAEERIGKKRLVGAYAWRSLLNSGAKIANGSDFPVEPTNPFYGLHASVTRQDRENQPLGGWISSEKLTREEAFKSFTIDAAYAGHQEELLGTLEPGKKADFILIDGDIFEQDETQLWKNTVIETWVNGKQVYKKTNY